MFQEGTVPYVACEKYSKLVKLFIHILVCNFFIKIVTIITS